MNNPIKHQMIWDEENGVAVAIGNGTADEEAALWMLAETEKMAKDHGGKLDWIVDLNGITDTTAKGRAILSKVTSHPTIRLYALVGGSVFIRTISNFIIKASGQKNARHFATREEALQWIQKSR